MTEQRGRAVVIGAGFAGLSAACSLAKDGWAVTVLEKNDKLGGRARTWEKDGFKFDMVRKLCHSIMPGAWCVWRRNHWCL